MTERSGELLMELYTRESEEDEEEEEEQGDYDEGRSEMQSFGITMSSLGQVSHAHQMRVRVPKLLTTPRHCELS